MNLRRFFCKHLFKVTVLKTEDGVVMLRKQCECGHQLLVQDDQLKSLMQQKEDATVETFLRGYLHATTAEPSTYQAHKSPTYLAGYEFGERAYQHAKLLARDTARRAA